MGRLWVTVNGKRKLTAEGRKKQYEKWGSTEKYKKDRAKRNSARRSAMRSGRVHKGDGKEIDHVKGLASGGSNKSSNLRVVPRKTNRSKKEGPRKRGSRRKTKEWGR